MTASATINHTTRETRRQVTVGSGDGQRTVRVRTGRSNSRRDAILASLGYGR